MGVVLSKQGDNMESSTSPWGVEKVDERNTFKYVMHELFSDDDEIQRRLEELEEEMKDG